MPDSNAQTPNEKWDPKLKRKQTAFGEVTDDIRFWLCMPIKGTNGRVSAALLRRENRCDSLPNPFGSDALD